MQSMFGVWVWLGQRAVGSSVGTGMGNVGGRPPAPTNQPPPPTREEQERRNAERRENRKSRQQQVGLRWLGKRTGPTPAGKQLGSVTPKQQCYLKYLKLERQHCYLQLEIEYLRRIGKKPEKMEDHRERMEIERLSKFRGLMKVGTLMEMIDDDHCVVEEGQTETYNYICSFVDRSLLTLKASVLCKATKEGDAGFVVGVMPETDINASGFVIDSAPKETYGDVAGLDNIIEELKETVELPLNKPEMYENMGIKPPTGVILYGPPGTGKTLLAKAVAHSTSATFLRASGSELVKSHVGEGPKQIRLLFSLARKHAPSIVFIDEVDAIGYKRFDTQCGGEREVQRTLLELLNQLDGFDQCKDVKVILATNRIGSLDSALIRPGRIDRKLELPLPDSKARMSILRIVTEKMHVTKDVDLEKLNASMDGMSGADIKCVCSEAGMRALRDRRLRVTMEDLERGLEQVEAKQDNAIVTTLYY